MNKLIIKKLNSTWMVTYEGCNNPTLLVMEEDLINALANYASLLTDQYLFETGKIK